MTSPNVSIEQIEPLSSNLEGDQSISNALKEIKQLQEEIKKTKSNHTRFEKQLSFKFIKF